MGRASRRKAGRPGPFPVVQKAAVDSPSFIKRPTLVLLLLAVVAGVIYSNSFSVPFQFDDRVNIVENPLIRDLTHFFNLSGTRAVGFLTFALNYLAGGLRVFGYHLVNLLVHVTNGFLVYSLVLLLFKASASKAEESAPFIALTTALLFVAHPIQTQAVTYIVQRFASLVTLFYLLAVVGYLKWRTGGRLFWYVASLISCILAMKTKENSFTIPFMLLLVEGFFFRPFTRKKCVALIPFLLTLLIIPLSLSGAIGEGEGDGGLARDTAHISRLDYLLTQFRVIITYLRLLVLPINQSLDYDYPIYRSLFHPAVLVSFLFLSALFALAIALLRRSTGTARHAPTQDQLKLIAFGILWFFLTLSVESSIFPIKDLIFEHRLYLPSVGIFLSFCASWGLLRRKTFALLSMGIIILLLSFATYQRNFVWKDKITLWQDVVEKAPQKSRGHYSLGRAYQERGMFEEAIQAYQKTVTLRPDYAEAHNNLGNIYKAEGRLDEAIQAYTQAFTVAPDHAQAHSNLGSVFEMQGRIDEAIREYQAALSQKPDSVEFHSNMGSALVAKGALDEAIRECQAALKLQPDYAEAHNNLGVAYKNQGRFDEAIREYQAALTLQPDNAQIHSNLGNVYMLGGRLDEAILKYKEALRLKPNFESARKNLDNATKKITTKR